MSGQRESRPVPDPTSLTTDALEREVAALKELIDLRSEWADALMDEKFRGVNSTFELIERQRVESKRDSTLALEAALIAQKEAVSKAEIATGKQIDSFVGRFGRVLDELRRELNALDARITTGEAIKVGGHKATTERRLNVGGIYAAIGAATATVTTVIGIAVFVLSQ